MRWLWSIATSLTLATIPGHAQQATVPADTNQVVVGPATEKVKRPIPMNHVAAEYPDEARRKEINGGCIVSLAVGVNGTPQEIKLVRCTDPTFGRNSLDAAAQYRFHPATTSEGRPVVTRTLVEITFRMAGGGSGAPLHYEFRSPPGTASSAAGADGVYPLTQVITPPAMTKFSDEGYSPVVFRIVGSNACDVVLTISATGKPSDLQIIQCGEPTLENPVKLSLLKSHYKPGSINGKDVPVRVSVHLEYGSLPSDN